MPAESLLRRRRLECGFTQAELAARAGVSRQLVAAVEAGRNVPAVDAALALAQALSTTVEQLYAARPAGVVAALGGRLRNGIALRVGRVGEQMVAAELADHGVAGASWAKPDAVLEAGELRHFPGASPAGVVVAGCDPALGVAEALLDGLGPRSLLALSTTTATALRALERESVHAAVVHAVPEELPKSAIPVVRWHLARWRVGLAVPAALRRQSFEAVLHANLPIAQRDPGATSQRAFERARIAVGVAPVAASPRSSGHLDAARIAAMLGGAAVTTEAAAHAFGLGFLALETHAVEVWVAERWREHPGIDALGELLATRAFIERVAQFGGYDLAGSGDRVTPSLN
jgi:DNA-binding XRE family transcriptional regulator/molybdate-binding protein